MRVEQRDGYRVVVGGPVPPQADAITLGKTIIVRKAVADSRALMAHELVHVRQFRELGPVRFLFRYVGSYLRGRLSGYGHMASYRRIPLEVEASWVSRLHSGVRARTERLGATGSAGGGPVPCASRPHATPRRSWVTRARRARSALESASHPTEVTSRALRRFPSGER